MEYEKKYKKALERAKTLYENANGMILKKWVEQVFPELKESEGERMLKFIKNQLFNIKKTITENYELDAKLTKAIEWLERQGDTNETINRDELAQGVLRGAAINLITWIDYNAAEGNMCLSNVQCKEIENALVRGDWNKIYAYMKKKLEKQSVKTSSFDFNPVDWQTSEVDGKIHNIYNSGVEPKFHKDEWVVNNATLNLCHILRVEHGQYICDDCSFPITKENEYHLWTIADAKDGDVLYSLDSNRPFIFKYRNPNEQATAYCGINKFGKFFVWNTQDCITTLDKYVPATKEQRDQLEKAMADAGYTFDFEKKELNKIEDEEYNGEDYGIDSLFHAQRILEKTLGKVDGYQTDDGILSHKCAITAVKKLYEKKPVKWSEEDEENLKRCIYFDQEEILSWLELIKQRMME